MEKAVERLEAMFQKTNSDVDSFQQRIKAEFESKVELQTNPADLIVKIGHRRRQYAELITQARALEKSHKQVVDEFRGQIRDICQLFQTLATKTGLEPTEKSEELNKLEQLLGTEIPWGQSSSCDTFQDTARSEIESNASPQDSTPLQELSTLPHSEHSKCSSEQSPSAQSSTVRRQHSNEFVEVDQSEFETVSSLVRGRVKLADVNSTYRTLWDYFKVNTKSKPVDQAVMLTMGLRVSGATGQAKLKVLRALKLVKISSKGDVSLQL